MSLTTVRTDDERGGFREVSSQSQNSMKVGRNAKGEFSWELKAYADTMEELETMIEDGMNRLAGLGVAHNG